GARRGRPDDGFVYGDLARLEAEIFAATGVEDALLRLCPGGEGGGAFGGSKGGGVDAAAKVSSVLRGVPWLSFVDEDGDGGGGGGDVEGRLLVWRPPAVVAEALDADLDADPTGWLSGFGGDVDSSSGDRGGVVEGLDDVESEESWQGGGGGGEEESGRRRRQRQLPEHPCLAQFEAYLSHRDDVDFAAGLLK
ncbi:unnamed protein product, partial [Ectocarpus fasciculatus]